MEEQTVLRFARLLSLPDYENTYSWLPVNGEASSKLPTSSSDIEISANRKNSQINGIKNILFVDLPTPNTQTNYACNDDFSPPIPDLSTLPTFEEVTFPVFNTDEKSNPRTPNLHSLLVGANSIPPSITLPNFSPTRSDDIDVSTKPSTLPNSSRLMRSFSFNRRSPGKPAATTLESEPLKGRFMSTGDIFPLSFGQPIKMENATDSFRGERAYGSLTTFPEYPITVGKLKRESGIVDDEHETPCYSAISGLSSVGDSDAAEEIIYVSRAQSDLEYAIPLLRSQSLTPLSECSDFNCRSKISPDRTSDISPYNHPQHSPLLMVVTTLGTDLPVLRTDDAGWMNSNFWTLILTADSRMRLYNKNEEVNGGLEKAGGSRDIGKQSSLKK